MDTNTLSIDEVRKKLDVHLRAVTGLHVANSHTEWTSILEHDDRTEAIGYANAVVVHPRWCPDPPAELDDLEQVAGLVGTRLWSDEGDLRRDIKDRLPGYTPDDNGDVLIIQEVSIAEEFRGLGLGLEYVRVLLNELTAGCALVATMVYNDETGRLAERLSEVGFMPLDGPEGFMIMGLSNLPYPPWLLVED